MWVLKIFKDMLETLSSRPQNFGNSIKHLKYQYPVICQTPFKF